MKSVEVERGHRTSILNEDTQQEKPQAGCSE